MIIVTGAAGFIGSNIVAALNARGSDDLALVDTAESHATSKHLRDCRFREFIPKDQLPDWVARNASRVESVLHMGACSDTTQTDRAFMMSTNFEYTRMLWQFCASHGKRLVYASSAATYGDGSAGYDDLADPRLLCPLNLYGESKHLFDLYALEQQQTPAGWAGLKFFNVYGPHENHKGRMASVVYHAFCQIKESGRVKLFKSARPGVADGGQCRDFVYVKDAVAAVLHFLNAPEKSTKGLFNVGTGKARTFADLAHAVFAALNLPPKIEYIAMPADLGGKYQYFTQAATDKLRASGFTAPFHTLEQGVKDYVDWLAAN